MEKFCLFLILIGLITVFVGLIEAELTIIIGGGTISFVGAYLYGIDRKNSK